MTTRRTALALFARAPGAPRRGRRPGWSTILLDATPLPAGEDLIAPVIEPRSLELGRLLSAAAEIEHCLLLQYLYAAYSVKPEFRAIAEREPDSMGLVGLAREEMKHLDTVNQALVALRMPPRLTRQDLPVAIGIYPFDFALEPLSAQSLAKYVYTEAPPGALDAPRGTDAFADRVGDLLGGHAANTLGSLYRTIIVRMKEVRREDRGMEPALGWDHWLDAMEAIRKDGEDAHYAFLRTLLEGSHPGLAGLANPWSGSPGDAGHPAHAIEADPGILDKEPGSDDAVRRLKRLANAHYWLVLALLDARYLWSGTHPQLASDLEHCAKQHMTFGISPIGRALAALGRGVPFDQLPMGYRWGNDLKSSFDALVRFLRSLQQQEARAIAEGLATAIPEPVSKRTLDTLGRHNG